MTNRQVKIPLVSYRDREGRVRHALQYENIDVGAEWLEDFGRLNLGDDYTAEAQRSSGDQANADLEEKHGESRRESCRKGTNAEAQGVRLGGEPASNLRGLPEAKGGHDLLTFSASRTCTGSPPRCETWCGGRGPIPPGRPRPPHPGDA